MFNSTVRGPEIMFSRDDCNLGYKPPGAGILTGLVLMINWRTVSSARCTGHITGISVVYF